MFVIGLYLFNYTALLKATFQNNFNAFYSCSNFMFAKFQNYNLQKNKLINNTKHFRLRLK